METAQQYLIFGKPIIVYLGMFTSTSFTLTAAIAILNKKGIRKIPFKWHKLMAAVSFFFLMIHGFVGLFAYP
jgi:hypothetical protein